VKCGVQVDIRWVRSHQDRSASPRAVGNREADKQAKSLNADTVVRELPR
jgi:hypothetical protein